MKQRGFTLIEMVLAIIVGGILVLGIAGFVELGTKGYANTVDRQRLQTQAKFVLEKLTREARHAVPNIFVNHTNNCISFYPIVDSGFYSVSGANLNFIVGDLNSISGSLSSLRLLINPTQQLGVGDDLSAINNSFDLSSASSISGSTFTLHNQAANLVGGSVVNRHYIANIDRQVTYCISADNRVMRGEGTTYNDTTLAPLTDAAWVSVSGAIRYEPASVQNNGIVHVDMQFSQNDEHTRFQHDVQVLNVP